MTEAKQPNNENIIKEFEELLERARKIKDLDTLSFLIDLCDFYKKSIQRIQKFNENICDSCIFKEVLDLMSRAQRKRAIKQYDLYFIESSRGLIKIGISKDPSKRLQELNSQTPYDLKLLAIIPKGGRVKEKELHEIFHQYRIFGEWFDKSPEIMKYIKKLKRAVK